MKFEVNRPMAKETIYQVWHHHGGESILLRETSFYSVARMVIDFYLGTGTRELRKITNFAPRPKQISSNEKTSHHPNRHHSNGHQLQPERHE